MSAQPMHAADAASHIQVQTPPPAIRVRNLWQRFGNSIILRDVSFEVPQGEIFGFIGPNGAGKTTTIRILTTLAEPSSGRAEVDGRDVVLDAVAVRRLVGYMPDHAGIYERVTVREYLEFFADAYAVASPAKGYAVVDASMELTDLVKLEGRLVATMSKGQKQRLQLARTLLHDPKVLILDEPASDLDPRARIEMRDLLVQLRKLGKTVFLSSHILTELADVCTSVAILERGRLVVTGPIHDIGRRLAVAREAAQAGPTVHASVPGDLQGAPYGQAQTNPWASAGTPDAAARQPQPVAPATRTLKLRLLGDVQAARATLASLGYANVTGVSGEALIVVVAGNDDRIAEMVHALVMAGHRVCGVEPERNELERIFLEVTQGDMQ
jgi:ABC-2 type transport system ATP-binding protein